MVEFFVSTMVCVALLPAAIYCVEVAFGCFPWSTKKQSWGDAARPCVAVLIPAHNEAAGIRRTLESVCAQLQPTDSVIVIADNCTDNTAHVASECGAIVFPRVDQAQRGKGYALAFGIEQLQSSPPDVVMFIDADCRLAPGSVDALVQAAMTEGTPVQGLNLCVPPVGSGAKHALSGLAFRFKNLIRMSGMKQLGGGCHLTGTGMAIPWKLIGTVPWASGNVVEDMQLGIDYTIAGYTPRFVPEARILSELPPSEQGMLQQRRRWEHGFLATAITQVPRLIGKAWQHRNWALLILALDMLVPPVALLSLLLTGAWLVAIGVWFAGYRVPLLFTTIVNTLYSLLTFVGWYVHCREVVPLKTFCDVPGYILAKLPVYLEFITRRQMSWVRAQRSAVSGSSSV